MNPADRLAPKVGPEGENKDDNKISSQKKYKNLPSKKQKDNKLGCCDFACLNCAILNEYLESRYEPICIIDDTGDSIFSPMHKKYHDEDKTSERNGRVFIDAEVVDSFLKKFKK